MEVERGEEERKTIKYRLSVARKVYSEKNNDVEDDSKSERK
jgi:hypothetical protein